MTPPTWHVLAAKVLEREQQRGRDRTARLAGRLERERRIALVLGESGPAYYAAAVDIALDEDRP